MIADNVRNGSILPHNIKLQSPFAERINYEKHKTKRIIKKGGHRMKEVPIWEKSNLTIEEAAAYFNIGMAKLRELTDKEA